MTTTILFFSEGVIMNWLLNSSPIFAFCIVTAWSVWSLRGHVGKYDVRIEKVEVKNDGLSQQLIKVDDRVAKAEEKGIALDQRMTEIKNELKSEIKDLKYELEAKIVSSQHQLEKQMLEVQLDLKSHFDDTVLKIIKHFAPNQKSQE